MSGIHSPSLTNEEGQGRLTLSSACAEASGGSTLEKLPSWRSRKTQVGSAASSSPGLAASAATTARPWRASPVARTTAAATPGGGEARADDLAPGGAAERSALGDGDPRASVPVTAAAIPWMPTQTPKPTPASSSQRGRRWRMP